MKMMVISYLLYQNLPKDIVKTCDGVIHIFLKSCHLRHYKATANCIFLKTQFTLMVQSIVFDALNCPLLIRHLRVLSSFLFLN